jgi:hypothetical protein
MGSRKEDVKPANVAQSPAGFWKTIGIVTLPSTQVNKESVSESRCATRHCAACCGGRVEPQRTQRAQREKEGKINEKT